jgi:hypothetical protein
MPHFETKSAPPKGTIALPLTEREPKNNHDKHENLRFVESRAKAERIALHGEHLGTPGHPDDDVQNCPVCEMNRTATGPGIEEELEPIEENTEIPTAEEALIDELNDVDEETLAEAEDLLEE